MKTTFTFLASTCCFFSVAQAAPAPQPKADLRVEREVKRVLAAYQKVGDFSISSSDTLNGTRRQTSVGRFARDGRVAIQFEDAAPPSLAQPRKLTALFDGTQLIEARDGQLETRQTVEQMRKAGVVPEAMFERSPGLDLVARLLKSKKLPPIPLGGQALPSTFRPASNGRRQIVRVSRGQRNGKPVRLTSVLTIGSDGFLQRVETRSRVEGGLEVPLSTSVLSRPQPVTGARPFNWVSLAPPIQVVISPESRAVLERAAKLYGGLKSLGVRLDVESNIYRDGSNVPIERSAQVQWERRGLLRFESASTRERVIVDGNRTHQFWNGQYSSDDLSPQSKQNGTLSVLASSRGFFSATNCLSQLLRGEAPVLASLDEYSRLKASLKPSQNWNGTLCDVVETEGVYDGDEGSLAEAEYWFAQGDGRLLRMVSKSYEGEQWRNIDDVRFEEQRFNPSFAASTFQVGLLK